MKTFKRAAKEELVELLSQKKLANLMFFGIIFLDALGAIFPEYLNRKVTIYFPFPIIFIIYLVEGQKANKLFLLALALNFLGICNFNNPYEKYNASGLIFHAIAYFIYCIILCQGFKIGSLKKVFKVIVPLIVLVLIPAKIYSEGMREMLVFNETVFYIFFTALYILFAVLVYMNNKNTTGKFLLFSAIAILLSSYFQGYNLFVNTNDLLNFFAVICFNLTHYLLCIYLLKRTDKEEQ